MATRKVMSDESQDVEYKESWRDEYLKWVCGFANANGGTMYIGVDDKKQIVGVSNSKKLMEDIPNKVASILGIVVDVNLLHEKGRAYIEIVVRPSSMPIAYKGQYHYRSGSTKQELKGVALQQFLMSKMGQSWDDIPLEDATLDSIDRDAIDYFIRRSISAGRMEEDERESSTERILKNLNLLTDGGKLKSAAILLFGKNVNMYFPSVEFKIGRFHSSESDLIIQDVIEGNIIQMADKVMTILRTKYLASPIRYEGMQRIEELEIPEKALREIIYNAIVHKDYTGSSIQMRVYDDCVKIWNYGLLPAGITPESLMREHPSRPRNKNLAFAFFKAGFIESWGRGFKKIREEMDLAKMPMPEVTEDCGGVMAVMKRFTMEEIISIRENIKPVDVTTKIRSNIELTKRQKAIWLMIRDNPYITAHDMAEELSLAERTIRRDLSIMQKAKAIRHEGGDKTGIWVTLE